MSNVENDISTLPKFRELYYWVLDLILPLANFDFIPMIFIMPDESVTQMIY